MSQAPEISVVVPVMNEDENVTPLVEAVRQALHDRSWELILVDDGSTDSTRTIVRHEARRDSRVRLLALARNYGQSTAMQAGFDHVRGQVVVTMDGDLQNDPRDIPMLLHELSGGYDLIAGYRIRRQDRLVTRMLPSWVANRIIARITGVPIRDNGCSLKVYTRELLSRMRLYSEMHRFIPAMAASLAGARIKEVGVRHHARARGESKYGLIRIFQVIPDLLAIKMIKTFRVRPLALFAGLAGVSMLAGALSLGATFVTYFSFTQVKADSMVFPALAILSFALSIFLLMLGLVGEVAIREHGTRRGRILPLAREGAPQ